MPRFRITLDSGQTLEIEADNQAAASSAAEQYAATNNIQAGTEQALAPEEPAGAFSEEARRAAYREEFDAMPWPQRMLVGAGKAFDDTALGVKDLFGGELTPEQESRTNTGELGVHGVAGTAGEIIGDLAIYGVPTALSGGLGMLTKAPKLAQGANMVSNALRNNKYLDAAVGAGMEGLKVGNDYRSRGDRLMSGVVGGGAGIVLGAGVNRATRGINVSDAAQNLMDKFDLKKLTPGDQSEGFMRGMEQTLSNLIPTSSSVQRMRQDAVSEWSDALRNRATQDAGFSPMGATTHDAWESAADIFSKKYDEIWDAEYAVRPTQIQNFKNRLTRLANTAESSGASADSVNTINRLRTQLTDQITRASNGDDVSGRVIQDVRDQLQKVVDDIYEGTGGVTREFRGAVENARDTIVTLLPKNTRNALENLDKPFREFKIMQGAAAASETPGFQPTDLWNSLARDSSDRSLAGSTQRLQNDVAEGMQVFNAPEKVPAADTFARAAYNLLAAPMSAVTNEPMRKVLTGGTAPQQAISRVSDALRLNERLIPLTAGRMGVAVGSENQLGE